MTNEEFAQILQLANKRQLIQQQLKGNNKDDTLQQKIEQVDDEIVSIIEVISQRPRTKIQTEKIEYSFDEHTL